MKALIAAALIAVMPTAVLAQPQITEAEKQKIINPADTDPITKQEAEVHAGACLAMMQGKVTAADLAKLFHLDTARKQRDFGLMCGTFLIGLEAAQKAAEDAAPKGGTKI